MCTANRHYYYTRPITTDTLNGINFFFFFFTQHAPKEVSNHIHNVADKVQSLGEFSETNLWVEEFYQL